MGVITEEIELPDRAALGMPAGLPMHSRNPISEITAFDRHAGDRTRQLFLAFGVGVFALGLYAVFGRGAPPEPPAPAAAPAITPPQADNVKIAPVEAPVTAKPEPKPELVVTKKAEPLPSRGKVAIEAEPRVVVYAGTKRLGRTPLEVELDEGLHELRLVNRKLHLDVRRKYRVRANKSRKIDLLFGVSKLVVGAKDGTKVYVDKRFVGRAPLKPIKLVEGNHHIKLVHGDQKLAERLYVPPSRTIEYNARL